jgi:hypothetical protein
MLILLYSDFMTKDAEQRWYLCPGRLSQRSLVSTKINGRRRHFRLLVLETFDDGTLDVDTIKVCSGLLQSHVSGLGEQEIDGEQLDENPYIVNDVVCQNLSVLVSLRCLFTLGKLTLPPDAV